MYIQCSTINMLVIFNCKLTETGAFSNIINSTIYMSILVKSNINMYFYGHDI